MSILIRKCQVLKWSICGVNKSSALTNFNINRSNDYERFSNVTSGILGGQRRNISLQSIIEFQQSVYTTISGSAPVGICQDALLNLHSMTGLPWWATIVVATFAIRATITFPLAIYQNYIMAKVELITLEFREIVQELQKEAYVAKKHYELNDSTLRPMYNRSLKKQWDILVVRDNCHPFKASLLLWVQMPMWISMSFAIRNLVSLQPVNDSLARITFTELTMEGFLWIPNLIETDHSLILPVFMGFLNLMIIEVQGMSRLQGPQSKLRRRVTNVFRGISVILAIVSAYVPSALSLYWTTSTAFALTQNLITLSPKLKRTCRIPETPSELENPYTHIKVQMGERINTIGTIFNRKPK